MRHNKSIFTIAALGGLLISSPAFAFTIPVKPANGWYITDTSNTLSSADTRTLNDKIENINKSSRNEIGVAMVSSLDGESIDDAAHDTFNSWGIGKAGLDNGLLIFVAVNDHKMRIEVGNGAEGDIPDMVAKQIITGTIPFFKKKDFAAGLNFDIDQISAKMASRVGEKPIVVPTTKPSASLEPSINASAVWWLVGAVIALLGVGCFFAARQKKKAADKWKSIMNTPRIPDVVKTKQPMDASWDNYVAPPVAQTPSRRKSITNSSEYNRRSATQQKSNDNSSSSYSGSSSSYDSGSSSSFDSGGSGFDGGSSSGGGSDGSW